MFPSRFFADRFFAPRYFAKVGADGAPVDSGTPSRNPMLASVGRLMNR